MKRIFAVICLAAVILCGVSFTRAEKNAASADMRIYPAGKYEVGNHFEEGEYILLSAIDRTGSFVVSVDAKGLDVISEASFESNTILTVLDGDFLELTDCTAVSADDYYSAYRIEPDENGGMLKVGEDIAPGEYELVGQAGKESVYRIYSDTRFRFVEEERAFHDTCLVRLSENQYLELIYCSVSEILEEEKPEETPAPTRRPAAVLSTVTPKPQPTPTPAPTPVPVKTVEPERLPKDQPDTGSAAPETMEKVRIDSKRSPSVRDIPSTKGEKIGVAEAGAEYELLEIEDKWYKIRLDDVTEGWITSGMAEIIE